MTEVIVTYLALTIVFGPLYLLAIEDIVGKKPGIYMPYNMDKETFTIFGRFLGYIFITIWNIIVLPWILLSLLGKLIIKLAIKEK